MNKGVEDMREYVCDTLCKFRNDNSLSQEELEICCAGCKLEAYTCDILRSLKSEAERIRNIGISVAGGFEAGSEEEKGRAAKSK